MQVSHDKYDHVRERIKAHEGCRLKRYKDSMGVLTVGWGHALTPDEIRHGTWDKISRAEADAIFEGDFQTALEQARKGFPVFWDDIGDARRGVLIEMVFQMGPYRVSRFKEMRSALAKKIYRKAAAEMIDSDWAEETPKRCFALALIMLTGQA